ncbi:hypothetical protein R1flu_017204 [Riccia fluitans]|uniref:Uncharacterized protein n=1 Tax=Riccia fluitans TaxID=41844 RepID=A0ABD1XDV8_9MARC
MQRLQACAASHRSPQLFYKHLKSIFDSYVNPDNNPDVQPLVKGLDAEDFDVDAFLDTNMRGRKEEMTPDFLMGFLYMMLEVDQAVDEPCSPPDRQIIFVVPSQMVDLTAVVSPEANRCNTTEWPRLSDLTKKDRESTYAKKYLRGDFINAYIFEKFLQRSREELFNMFYCSTFWFAKASQQVDAYDMTSHLEVQASGIKRLRNALYPQLRDCDFNLSRCSSLDFCADPWKVPLVIGAHPTSRNNMRNDALDSFPASTRGSTFFTSFALFFG